MINDQNVVCMGCFTSRVVTDAVHVHAVKLRVGTKLNKDLYLRVSASDVQIGNTVVREEGSVPFEYYAYIYAQQTLLHQFGWNIVQRKRLTFVLTRARSAESCLKIEATGVALAEAAEECQYAFCLPSA